MTLIEQNSQSNPSNSGSSVELVPSGASKFTSLVFRAREFGIFGILIVLVLLTTAIKPRFLAGKILSSS